MSRLLTFLMLLIVLAIVQAAAVALVVGLLLALLYFFATRPRETLLYLGSLALLGLASARPLAFIVALSLIGVVAVLARSNERSGSSQSRIVGRANLHRNRRLDGDDFR